MSDHTADVAAVLWLHVIVRPEGDPLTWCTCLCWSQDRGDLREDESAHNAHAAAALLASEPIAQALAAVEALARVEALAETWERSGFATGRLHADDIRAALRPEGGKS